MLVQVPSQRPKAKLNMEFLKKKILINITLGEVLNYHLTRIWETLCSSVNNDPALLFEEGIWMSGSKSHHELHYSFCRNN